MFQKEYLDCGTVYLNALDSLGAVIKVTKWKILILFKEDKLVNLVHSIRFEQALNLIYHIFHQQRYFLSVISHSY